MPFTGVRKLIGTESGPISLSAKAMSILSSQVSPRPNMPPEHRERPDDFTFSYCFELVLVGMRGAYLREKPFRGFEVVVVAFQSGILEHAGDLPLTKAPK